MAAHPSEFTPEHAGTITIRRAQARDVAAAVPLIYSSGPTAFDYVFAHDRADRAKKFLAYAFTRGDGEFGHRNHLVVEQDGVVCGIGSGFDGRQTLGFTLANARQILSFYGALDAWSVMARGLRCETVIRPPSAGQYYVCHLGVAPELRGQGLGVRLVTHLLAEPARARSMEAALDVSVDNPRAQALYERLGFRVETTRVSKLRNSFGAVADHRRMTCPL
jgi:ribosomal protein S18 acetylase RimI-like enzyme